MRGTFLGYSSETIDYIIMVALVINLCFVAIAGYLLVREQCLDDSPTLGEKMLGIATGIFVGSSVGVVTVMPAAFLLMGVCYLMKW